MSDPSRKSLLAVLVALCAAAVGWRLVGDGEIGLENGGAAATSDESPAAAEGDGDSAAAADTAGHPKAAEDGERSPLGEPADAELTIRLCGLQAEAPWTTAVHVAARDDDHDTCEHEAVPDADGRCRFALPRWANRSPTFAVTVTGDDPAYAMLEQWLPGPLDLEHELQVDVQVVAQFAGRVLDPDAKPVEWARVTAFAIRDGGPVDEKVGETNTDANGAFRLRAPPATPLLLVAAPMQRGWGRELQVEGRLHDAGELRDDLLAAAQTVQGRIGQVTTVADFVLQAATRVTGSVRWHDGTPVLLATVRTRPQPAPTFHFEPQSFVQDLGQGRLAPGAAADTDDQGAFVLPGLTGVAVDLQVTGLQEAALVGQGPSLRVVPPQPAEFVLPQPVHLRVTRDRIPVPQARIALAGIGTTNTDASGALDVVCLQPVRVRANHERWRSRWLDLLPAAAGTTVVLALDDLLAEVALEFEGPLRVRNVTVDWRSDDGREGHQHLLRDDRRGPFQVFLQPGRYHLRVGAGAGERNGVFLLPSEHDLTVTTERVTQLLLPAAFGGTFTLTATDANGVPLLGHCRVFDAEGVDRSERFTTGFAAASAELGVGELLPGRNMFDGILPAGRYELRLDLGANGTRELGVTIRTREVTAARVRL